MNPTFVVNYNPFDKESSIALIEDGKQKNIFSTDSEVNDVAQVISILAKNYGVTDVKVNAPLMIFNEIDRIIKSEYAETNLNLEIY